MVNSTVASGSVSSVGTGWDVTTATGPPHARAHAANCFPCRAETPGGNARLLVKSRVGVPGGAEDARLLQAGLHRRRYWYPDSTRLSAYGPRATG